MVRHCVLLVCIVFFLFIACSEELMYEGELKGSRYIARSFNARDLMELTFVDGTVLAVDDIHMVFTPGEYYYIYSGSMGYLNASKYRRGK